MLMAGLPQLPGPCNRLQHQRTGTCITSRFLVGVKGLLQLLSTTKKCLLGTNSYFEASYPKVYQATSSHWRGAGTEAACSAQAVDKAGPLGQVWASQQPCLGASEWKIINLGSSPTRDEINEV